MLPFLRTKSEQAAEYEALARECGADFFEFYLDLPHDEAIGRLLKRGSWGEPDAAPFTEEDLPRIEALYQTMVNATAERSGVIKLHPHWNQIDATYQEMLRHIR